MINILVLGAGGAAGMNFIDSLMMAGGYNVVGLDINQWHLELVKARFGIKGYLVPEIKSLSRELDKISFINDIIEKENAHFIHAQPDVEVEFLSRNLDMIKATTFLPASETIEKCRDKYRTATILTDMAPTTYLADEDRIEHQIKSIQSMSGNRRVWLRATKGAGSRAALPVHSSRQALDWMHYWYKTKRLESYDFMLSEFLPGKEYAFQSVWRNGEIITSMARERVEYLMGNLFPSGQSSSPSVARTVHNDKVNAIATEAILRIDSDASGIFCVDMKEDKWGCPRVTEINAGRFFTTSNFFSTYGANMPDTYVKWGVGLLEEIGNPKKYNAIEKDIMWIRGVDTLPYGFKEVADVV
jgi:hypothetical protein